MIEWLDTPFKGTNKRTGFETLVHGFFITDEIYAITVDEDGFLGAEELPNISLDWRFKRGKGWFSIDDPEPEG